MRRILASRYETRRTPHTRSLARISVRPPHRFYAPLAMGAPLPYRELPVRLERAIHFFPPHLAHVRARVQSLALAGEADVVCGNLEDGIANEDKVAARRGVIELACNSDLGSSALWVRVNALESLWYLDDVAELVAGAGNRLAVIMLPKVEGEWDIHAIDQYLAQLEARHRLAHPLLVHALIESSMGVINLERIAAASPRLHGVSLGPADLAASRGIRSTRIGGWDARYAVPGERDGDAPRVFAPQDPWHSTLVRLVDACRSSGVQPFCGPFGDIDDDTGCAAWFGNAAALGCAGGWSLSPRQLPFVRAAFTPGVADVLAARRVLEALPEGTGVAMVDGRMHDDATWKQAQSLLEQARRIAERDPAMREAYGF